MPNLQSQSLWDRIRDRIAGPLPPPPARPAPPAVAPEAYDYMRINELKVREVANIVANENRDVMPLIGRTTGDDLQRARIAQAHAIISADKMYGPDRLTYVGTAENVVTARLENSDQYRRALDAARTAFREQESGYDPLGNRVYFNNRFNDYTGPRQLENESVGIFQRYGPFQLGNGIVYTIINENPRYMPPPRRRR